MHLQILKINETVYEGEALSVTVPGVNGELTILPNHANLLTPLREGVISYTTEKDAESLEVQKGFVESSPTGVTILL